MKLAGTDWITNIINETNRDKSKEQKKRLLNNLEMVDDAINMPYVKDIHFKRIIDNTLM